MNPDEIFITSGEGVVSALIKLKKASFNGTALKIIKLITLVRLISMI
tara:strand:- start:18 stop:158 length:141 start_codon:yes stop_codon:yes gene_type:complete